VNVSQKTIRRRIASGELPAVKLGGLIRVDADDLEQFLVERLIGRQP
jgi:excisionase family DNA binding protein